MWVRGEDDVLDAVRRCWASLFTDRATCYRLDRGLDHLSGEMGVVVQKMVQPRSAGVAFTLNPANGDRSAIAIESSWGFGEAVVAGEVTPELNGVPAFQDDLAAQWARIDAAGFLTVEEKRKLAGV